ncbi:MAG: class I SAM-dependent methyltransferase [Gemmatimonadetes bacterium]|nr:class I SAM-dependent methyltransferase [Gemmatimonadota bacterium]MBK7714012.1 class I SAM-dependent methyltransferase [Gemmatimonadota bacterium]MBK7783067.1 class I SAM-dependent methyltransferase [Gemmatimonadota bacterium]MBK9068883.1 class I SAM-dependent methyltransferase [Gemmatimonadota bacterium]
MAAEAGPGRSGPADRRHAVPFDAEHFARQAAAGAGPADALAAFRQIYQSNHWRGSESASGAGASGDQTARIRAELPVLCRALGVRRLLDLPCGEGHWMARVDLAGITYLGADLLPEVVGRAALDHGGAGREFLVLDLTASPLPPADLLLCRDALVHLSFADIGRALVNLRRAGIPWLLTTTFPDEPANEDIVTGDWRPLNLERAPFHFPAPVRLFSEGCTEGAGRFADKSLALWRIADLPVPA